MDKKVILVADDDVMSRRVIQKFLSTRYEVLEAGNGVDAMHIINSRHIDGMILDIIMPEKDGIDVLKELQNKKEYASIGILVASSTKERTERMALNAGADDVVAKPYDPTVILKRMENILIKKLYEREHQLTGLEAKKEVIWQDFLQKEYQDSVHYIEQIGRLNDIIEENSGDERRVLECTGALRKAVEQLQELMTKQS